MPRLLAILAACVAVIEALAGITVPLAFAALAWTTVGTPAGPIVLAICFGTFGIANAIRATRQ
jgi:hypothetical protein